MELPGIEIGDIPFYRQKNYAVDAKIIMPPKLCR